MIAVVAVVVAGATGAFFSDTETSTGNTFTAGAIDLGIDNHSYYNGELNEGTTWRVDYDISDETPRQFFNFLDLKPGDWGEDTISIHVKDNDAYVCADVTLTSNLDNSSTEPEMEDGDEDWTEDNTGELANAVRFYWWADDGDNVYEDNESLIHSNVALGNGTVALADSQTNIWGDLNGDEDGDGPLPGNTVKYIAKAWCFGDAEDDEGFFAYSQDNQGGTANNGPDDGRPVVCSGANEGNKTQTDSLTADIAFRAVQSRNNESFVCSRPN